VPSESGEFSSRHGVSDSGRAVFSYWTLFNRFLHLSTVSFKVMGAAVSRPHMDIRNITAYTTFLSSLYPTDQDSSNKHGAESVLHRISVAGATSHITAKTIRTMAIEDTPSSS
jgi:hypothetical protein